MNNNIEGSELKEFAEWVVAIGDGDIGASEYGCGSTDIHDDISIKFSGDPVAAIVKSTYPSAFMESCDLSYLQDGAIFCTNQCIVKYVNDYMMSLNQWESKVVLS